MTRENLASPIEPPSHEVLDEIENHVQCCLGGRIRDFAISCQNGGLVLQGRTSTYPAKQLAQELVMAMIRIPILTNDMEVS
jgi:hypothetical protein